VFGKDVDKHFVFSKEEFSCVVQLSLANGSLAVFVVWYCDAVVVTCCCKEPIMTVIDI
jgi:hypothetical protein